MEYLKQFRDKIERINHPAGMAKVNGEITGPGFFPGASGASDDFKSSKKSILVLGQDQDRVEGFEKSKGKRHEKYTPTWKHMERFFDEVGIKMEDCFFTNCLLGVRENAEKNTGKSPGFAHPDFVEECAKLLREEIQFFQPKIILCLGLVPFRFLGLLSREILIRSVCVDEFKELDAWNFQLTAENSLLAHPIQITVLCHPSYRKLNAQYRKFGSLTGENAEIEILKEALKQVNYPQ
jgi:uracil-DNA glycosylase